MQEHVLEIIVKPVRSVTDVPVRTRCRDRAQRGVGDTAIRNYDKWKEIRVQMDTIAENKPVDTSLELFGKKFKYPFFAGPVGAVGLHYGDCLDDVAYNDILVSSCAKYGIAAFTGDGVDSNVMVAATKAIKKTDGIGIPTVKPWNLDVIAGRWRWYMNRKPSQWRWILMQQGFRFLRIWSHRQEVRR